MNISKLITDKGNHARVETGKVLTTYAEDNKCLIAYYKDIFGTFFLIKTKRKYMAFIKYSIRNLETERDYTSYYLYTLYRINLKCFFSLCGKIQDKLTILNQKEFNKLQKIELLNSITEKDEY